MPLVTAVELMTQGGFVALTVITAVDAFRYRDGDRIDVALAFATFGGAIALGWVQDVTGVEHAAISWVAVVAIMAQPFMLLRVASGFVRVPHVLMLSAGIGLAVVALAMAVLPRDPVTGDLPSWAVLALVAYFVVVELYAAGLLVRGAFTRRGTTRRRLRYAAVGTGLLAAVIFIAGGLAVLPDPMPAGNAVAAAVAEAAGPFIQALALAAAASFYLGFSPPARLRAVWHALELDLFLRSRARGSAPEEDASVLVRRLCERAGAILDGRHSAVLLEDVDGVLTLRAGTLPFTVSAAVAAALDADKRAGPSLRPVAEVFGAPAAGSDGVAAVVPIASAAHAWGYLVVVLPRRTLFIDEDLTVLATFADLVGVALDHADFARTQRGLMDRLIESEERFRSVAESAEDAVFTGNADGIVTFANHGAQRMFGGKADAFEGMHLLDALGIRDVADRQSVGARLAAVTKGQARPDADGSSVVTVHGDDDTELSADIALSAWSRGGERYYSAIARDVTNRERAAQESRLLLDLTTVLAGAANLHEGLDVAHGLLRDALGAEVAEVWVPDEDGQALRLELSTSVKDVPELVAFRDEAKDLRFKPGIGLAGVAWSHRAPQWWPDVTVEERFLRREAASAAGLRAALAVPIGSRDDVQAVVCCFFASKRRADDNALAVARAVAAQVRNVVARRRAEAQLELHAADLERSNLDLERFAYVASHDLQEPLRMVTSYLQLLQRRYGDALDSDAREFIQFAVDGSVRMQALIDGLLSYSRVGTARQAAEPVDLDAVARSVLDDLAVPIKEARATVDVGPLPIVPGSRVQLAQLLQNLIANGIKFSGDADPVVTVRATEDEQGWRFVVADNGIGIEPRHAERVFEVFQRLHGRGQYSGTGIGLAVARRVVERHNGRIWVESRPGEGAQFFFTLPRVT